MKLPALILLALILLPGPASAGGTLKVNTSIKPPFSTEAEDGFFDLIIKELTRRTGIGTELVRQPPERALVSANQGLSDMELPRIAGLEKAYPNLVMVPEKVIDYKFVAFSLKETDLDGWDDLSGHRVGYLIGWKIFEKNVPKSAEGTKLKQPYQLMDMLSLGRLDIALYELYAGRALVRRHGLIDIHECEPPLAVRPMYIYVHKDNAYLVPLLNKALKAMKADGTYDRIADKTLHAR